MIRDILFGDRSIELLKRGLDTGALRMKVIAENVANVETPGYRAREVRFEELLGEAQTASAKSSLPLARSDAAHLSAGGGTGAAIERPRIFASATRSEPSAASNVDVERELVEMQKNEIQFQALSQVLADKYRGLKDAIRPS
jgi:flagellar basal-body rod protein FlgB